MIKSFKHKGLELFFTQNDGRLLNPKQISKLAILLDVLDHAENPKDLALPGTGLHQLSGDKKKIWSMKISANWRLTFRFEQGHAFEVNLEDYH